MKKIFEKIFDAVAFPFIALAVHIDESKRINEDDSWGEYLKRKNKDQIRRKKKCRR